MFSKQAIPFRAAKIPLLVSGLTMCLGAPAGAQTGEQADIGKYTQVRDMNAVTVTDENGARFATYTYDAQGRAVVTEHAGGVERYVLGYSSDGSHTLVTDPLGSQYTHNFQTILGVAKSTGQS